MHRQASFIVNFFPEGTVVGEDVGVFAFPDIDPGVKGALIAGELGAVFSDRPEVRAFISAFISPELQCAQGKSGRRLSDLPECERRARLLRR